MALSLENLIKDLIQKEIYSTQTDLVNALQKQGVNTKQSTVSRALNRLGAVKSLGPQGRVAYRLISAGTAKKGDYHRGLVHQIAANEVMVVLNTRSGSAGHVAQFVDEQEAPEIIGTLAGDNCIFVMPSTQDAVVPLIKRLKSLFPDAAVL